MPHSVTLLTLVFHKQGDFISAKKFCRYITEIPRTVQEGIEYREFADLFRLLILFDENNDMDFLAEETERFHDRIRRQYEDYRFETIFIRFFRKIVFIKKEKERKKEFENLCAGLSALRKKKIQYIEQMFSKFDFLEWAKNKITL